MAQTKIIVYMLGNLHSKTLKTFQLIILMVDKAAHAHEPEVLLWVGRFFHGLRSVILMGDKAQLAPTVTSESHNMFTAQYGMNLFVRL